MTTCFMGHPFGTDTKAAKFCQYTEKVPHRDANGGEHCHPSLLYTRSTVHHGPKTCVLDLDLAEMMT